MGSSLSTFDHLGKGTGRFGSWCVAEPNWRVAQARCWVAQHYRDRHLTLKQLSVQFTVSEHYLGRLFQEQVGLSFRQYVRGVRLARAEELLTIGRQNIKEIADAVGYSRSSNFDRDFRTVYHLTPGEYRAAYTKQEERLAEAPVLITNNPF